MLHDIGNQLDRWSNRETSLTQYATPAQSPRTDAGQTSLKTC